MINGKRVAVVLPAYNAARTLTRCVQEIPPGVVDTRILVDDGSQDDTAQLARELGLEVVFEQPENGGYGANQKRCYQLALEDGADIVVMLHPDYQYAPGLLPALAWPIAQGHYELVLGSRMLGGGALAGGMPPWKYGVNRLLTGAQNALLGKKLSETHTGYRAYSRALLEQLPWQDNADDFVFDAQLLTQAVHFGFRIGEVSVPTRYAPDSSSIQLRPAMRYGAACLETALRFRLQRLGLLDSSLFKVP
ncbi:MAG: glycosyltransferase family 2 protein [Myxococcota bacterium]|nr:glycosyltransferase family 2 protein [Myxococcota bacterium]